MLNTYDFQNHEFSTINKICCCFVLLWSRLFNFDCVCVQARFDAGELITQRELVSRQVSEDLTERASTFGLILDDVSLVMIPPQVLSRPADLLNNFLVFWS